MQACEARAGCTRREEQEGHARREGERQRERDLATQVRSSFSGVEADARSARPFSSNLSFPFMCSCLLPHVSPPSSPSLPRAAALTCTQLSHTAALWRSTQASFQVLCMLPCHVCSELIADSCSVRQCARQSARAREGEIHSEHGRRIIHQARMGKAHGYAYRRIRIQTDTHTDGYAYRHGYAYRRPQRNQ